MEIQFDPEINKKESEKLINTIKEKYSNGDYTFSLYVTLINNPAFAITSRNLESDDICKALNILYSLNVKFRKAVIKHQESPSSNEWLTYNFVNIELYVKYKDINKAPISKLGFPMITPLSIHDLFQILNSDVNWLKEWCESNLGTCDYKIKETEE